MTIAMSTTIKMSWRGKDEAAFGAAIKDVVERAIAAGTIGETSPYYGMSVAEYRAVTA